MRKVILMLCLMAAMCAGSASAQGKHFAIEFGTGMNFGLADLGKDKFSGNKSSADLYVSYVIASSRVRLKWDCMLVRICFCANR